MNKLQVDRGAPGGYSSNRSRGQSRKSLKPETDPAHSETYIKCYTTVTHCRGILERGHVARSRDRQKVNGKWKWELRTEGEDGKEIAS